MDMANAVLGFVAKNLGVPNVGTTPGNLGQCVGLSMLWLTQHGVPNMWHNACDLLANADPKYVSVTKNEPGNRPPPGTVICWDSSWGGGYGHTAVVVESNVNTVVTFEQNDPDGHAPQVLTHNYNGVQGWMTMLKPEGIT